MKAEIESDVTSLIQVMDCGDERLDCKVFGRRAVDRGERGREYDRGRYRVGGFGERNIDCKQVISREFQAKFSLAVLPREVKSLGVFSLPSVGW
jgi:hypothetical protein